MCIAGKIDRKKPRMNRGSSEAQTGFEPVHQGVADPRLTTWLLRPILLYSSNLKSTNDSNGNRTRVTAVKGRCLNRLTMEPSQTCLSGCTNEPYLIWLPNKSGIINNRSLNQFTSYPTDNLTKNILSQLSSFGKRKLMNSKTFYNSGCQFLRRHAAILLEQENSAIHGAEKCHILEHFLRPWNKMYK